ncbi:peptidoglycan D,D-transpeptidase FtsI family protein [Alteriqipengyuania lutimaris]|uniref:Penicillin-binding protein 2 n=1 Tax=Alteriqipengyuania lutimaris TaxID=1538146 RepID=A0A395LSP9_9SPHN|nr:penicillin-binding protein 2 [Alteriqipengyuania lutimaris]MBB3033395.1 cell division protein FtsI (penicillin-binding protein 3) [Alteriqipengyuania lutimaris]RDS77580.1 penicillin-binding protein 2 [Alteriqipengyuania lutimaris]
MASVAIDSMVAAGPLRVANKRLESLLMARMRALLLMPAFGLVAVVALLRIASFGVLGAPDTPMSMEQRLLPPRGEITDRNGLPLARNYNAFALWFNPKAMKDGGSALVRSPDEVAHSLAEIFPELDEADVAARLASGKAQYLRRRLLPEEANRVFDIGEPALELPAEKDRFYPQGSMAAHVLGYVKDGEGHLGMEAVLQDELTDAASRGEPTAIAIDLRVQGALEDELRKGMLSVNARGAAGVILDVESGEIVALASLPAFDPNDITAEDLMVSEAQAKRGETPRVFNSVTNQVYELGSTFKPLSFAAAIDAGIIRDLSLRYDAKPVKVAGRTLSDSHSLGDTLNVPEALIHSSNTVTARVADKLGGDRLRDTMRALGLAERPYMELPARGAPIWPGEKWSRITTMTVSYGHGIAVTPLHLASAYAAMVNGGIWRPATLRKVEPGTEVAGRRVFKEDTSARMRQLLRMITVYGTGKSANAPGYRVGGKTGSAEKPSHSGYRERLLVSTFAAAFPMDHPRYVVVTMLDEPKGTTASSFQRTAAWNAAPIVGKLIPRIGPMLDVRPDLSRDIDISDLRPLIRSDIE